MFTTILLHHADLTLRPLDTESIAVILLPDGDVQVTCSDPDLSCLVLFQSTAIIDQVSVGIINSFIRSTVFSVTDNFNDVYVVVYSWDSEQSIFDGKVSLITSLHSPTSKCVCIIYCMHACA